MSSQGQPGINGSKIQASNGLVLTFPPLEAHHEDHHDMVLASLPVDSGVPWRVHSPDLSAPSNLNCTCTCVEVIWCPTVLLRTHWVCRHSRRCWSRRNWRRLCWWRQCWRCGGARGASDSVLGDDPVDDGTLELLIQLYRQHDKERQGRLVRVCCQNQPPFFITSFFLRLSPSRNASNG